MSEKQPLEQEKQTYNKLLSISLYLQPPTSEVLFHYYSEDFCESWERQKGTSWIRDLEAQEESRLLNNYLYLSNWHLLLPILLLLEASQQSLGKETYTHIPGSEVHSSEKSNMEKQRQGRQPTIRFLYAFYHLYLTSASPGPPNFPFSPSLLQSCLPLITQHLSVGWEAVDILLPPITEMDSSKL